MATTQITRDAIIDILKTSEKVAKKHDICSEVYGNKDLGCEIVIFATNRNDADLLGINIHLMCEKIKLKK